jgi:hypothetical protein
LFTRQSYKKHRKFSSVLFETFSLNL